MSDSISLAAQQVLGFITPAGVLGVAAAVALLYAVLSGILLYHWRSYTVQGAAVRSIVRLYLGVSGTLFLSMLAAAASYLAA